MVAMKDADFVQSSSEWSRILAYNVGNEHIIGNSALPELDVSYSVEIRIF